MCGCRSGVFCGGLCGARWILICEGRGVSWRLWRGEEGRGGEGESERLILGEKGRGWVRTFRLLGLLRLGGLRS